MNKPRTTTNKRCKRTRVGHEWYNSGWWKRVRARVLIAQPICRACRDEWAAEVDHIVPHRGDYDLFHDPANLQGLCGRCHKQKTARGE